MKYKTVYDGERALIIDRNGKKSVFDGPKRVIKTLLEYPYSLRF